MWWIASKHVTISCTVPVVVVFLKVKNRVRKDEEWERDEHGVHPAQREDCEEKSRAHPGEFTVSWLCFCCRYEASL